MSTLVLPEYMTMRAAVYVGNGHVEVQTVPVPEIGPGELLVRVEACGICHTDLKKVERDLLPPPRIYGHEMAGVVERAGEGVTRFKPGDRVVVLHHIPCRNCFYCDRKLYAQCESYKRVGVTAGFAPAGGGFSQYIRVMDWIVPEGVIAMRTGSECGLDSLVRVLGQRAGHPGAAGARRLLGGIGQVRLLPLRRR